MKKVFVYGTLRKGGKYHYYLKHAVCVSANAFVYGQLYDTQMGYPSLVLGGEAKVKGEVYVVSAEQLAMLDELEEYREDDAGRLYNRTIVKAETEHGPMDVILYFFDEKQAAGLPKIDGNDWLK